MTLWRPGVARAGTAIKYAGTPGFRLGPALPFPPHATVRAASAGFGSLSGL